MYEQWPSMLLLLSILTGLGVQGIKAFLGDKSASVPKNVIAVILSAVLSVLAWVLCGDGSSFLDNGKTFINFLFFIYLNFIVTTVGYDKVVQSLEQFRKGL